MPVTRPTDAPHLFDAQVLVRDLAEHRREEDGVGLSRPYRERTRVSRPVPDVRRPCKALASGDEHLGLHVDEHHLSACTTPAINGLKQPGPLRLRAPLRSRQVPSLQRPG
jgi:hypothetical protein